MLFTGWFGPRGLATIVLGLIYLEELTAFSINPLIVKAMIATVLLSIFAHGISAQPAIRGDFVPEITIWMEFNIHILSLGRRTLWLPGGCSLLRIG